MILTLSHHADMHISPSNLQGMTVALHVPAAARAASAAPGVTAHEPNHLRPPAATWLAPPTRVVAAPMALSRTLQRSAELMRLSAELMMRKTLTRSG